MVYFHGDKPTSFDGLPYSKLDAVEIATKFNNTNHNSNNHAKALTIDAAKRKFIDDEDKLNSLSTLSNLVNLMSEDSDDEQGSEGEESHKHSLIPFPKGTVRVGVSDVYDWYKLGTHINDLDDADPNDFGKGPPQTMLSFGSEEEEHRYMQDLKRLGMRITDLDEGVKKR